MVFREKIWETAQNKQTNIILALDFPFQNSQKRRTLYKRAAKIIDTVISHVCAVKFNHHLVLPLGIFNGVQKLIEKAHAKGLPTIMDCKVNDIGDTNRVIAEYYFEAGFDALIANPFVGWEEGLKPVFEIAKYQGRGVILLVYMSHKGADEGYGQTVLDAENGRETPQYLIFARKALQWNADGAVVGATYPQKIRDVHAVLGGKIPIYSPGVGVQGGEIESALKAGASYLIVGRAITLADNPAETAEKIKNLAWNFLTKRCEDKEG